MTMRAALALPLLLAAGCHDDTGRLDAHEGIQHALEERVGKLESHLGAIDPEAAAGRAVAPLSDRVAKLEARVGAVEAAMAAIPKPSPELHLFAAGEDLGRWTGGLTSFSPKYGAIVDWSGDHLVGYVSDDCSGDDTCIQGAPSVPVPGVTVFDREGGAVVFQGLNKAVKCTRAIVGGECVELGVSGYSGRALHDGAALPAPSTFTIRQ